MSALYYTYRNLHTGTFSVQHKSKVIARPNCLIMKNVVFKVSQKGRDRVIEEKQKNVHAKIAAESILLEADMPTSDMIEVTYDPYKQDSFVIKSTSEPIFSAQLAVGINNKIFVII